MKLLEKTRRKIIDDSKNRGLYSPVNQNLGKNRFERRKHSSISKSVRDYNRIDMNTFFKKDILNFEIEVRGETDNYKVKIKLNNIIDELKKILKRTNRQVEFKNIVEAITRVFEHDDVYLSCTCPDWKYRFDHWAHVGQFASSKQDPGPGKGIANPNNDKGSGCKHVLLVMANKDWVMKVSSTINNYINYMKDNQERLYQSIIFPSIYGVKYSDEIQDQLFNPDTGNKARNYLSRSRSILDKANKFGKDKNKFKQGNKQGMRFTKDDNSEDQVKLDLSDSEEDNTKEI